MDDAWIKRVLALANDTLKLAHRRGAKQLVSQIYDLGAAIRPEAAIGVVGKRSSGKSTLINALVGEDVTPMEDDVATDAYIRIAAAPAARAVVVFRDPEREPLEVPFAELSDYAMVGGAHSEGTEHVEIGHPSPLLGAGITLFDTPGLGGLADAHTVATLLALDQTDAALLVLDASGPIDAEDLELLRTLQGKLTHVAVAGNKVEALADPEEHLARVRAHAELVVAVSGWSARAALDEPEQATLLREVSGLDALEAALRALLAAVVSAKYRLLLDRISAALDALSQPDREQIELAERDADRAARVRQLTEQIERLARLQPASALSLSMSTLRTDVAADYAAEVANALERLRRTVSEEWSEALNDRLPALSEAVVRAAWLRSLQALRAGAAEAAAEVLRGMGADDVLDLDDDEGTLPDSYVRSDEIPPVPPAQSRLERSMKAWRNVMLIVGGANLVAPGLGFATLPAALPAGFAMARMEEKAMLKRQTRQAALMYLNERERRAAGLNNALAARATRLQASLASQLMDRQAARRETLATTLAQLRDASAELGAAQARLRALEPLLATRDELAAA